MPLSMLRTRSNLNSNRDCRSNVALREDNQKLLSTEMKYRFIRALNVVPLTLQYLDDAFEGGDARKLQIVHTTVNEYEQALKQKSDSIIKAEREKQEQLK